MAASRAADFVFASLSDTFTECFPLFVLDSAWWGRARNVWLPRRGDGDQIRAETTLGPPSHSYSSSSSHSMAGIGKKRLHNPIIEYEYEDEYE